MRDLIIDDEFRHKLPPLQADVLAQLEESILADGEVREPLVVWNNTLIDGHHRWQIIQRHPEIPYTVKRMTFHSKWEAFVWMYRNQLGRRNLTAEERTYFIGRLYAEQKRAQGSNNQYVQAKRENRQNDGFQETAGTAQAIAKEYGIGSRTVERAGEFAHGLDAAEEVAPGFRDAVLTGEVKAPKATVAGLRKLPEPERKQAVEAIKDHKVVDLSALRAKKFDQDMRQIDEDLKICEAFTDAVYGVHKFFANDNDMNEVVDAIIRHHEGLEGAIAGDIENLDIAIKVLGAFRNKLIVRGGRYGKK